ncbi:alpha/beta fold hydrolase [Streptomyces europaeiscabiei]|uniref:alpha/beta fold hydrolase n=1 Tax=Streptomyces europaeiscabiei TaxID=146819 RepID=UPI0038D37DE4
MPSPIWGVYRKWITGWARRPGSPSSASRSGEATPATSAVLVHGLYHQPEHFIRVTEGLRAVGVDVVAPELHRGSLIADTAAVQAAVDVLPEPPLVLGHSYGGSVLTGLRGVGRLVYLAAFVPHMRGKVRRARAAPPAS